MGKYVTTLEKLLSERVVIGDGAMGTMLYQHGVFLNQCFDELNITNPQLVKRILIVDFLWDGCEKKWLGLFVH